MKNIVTAVRVDPSGYSTVGTHITAAHRVVMTWSAWRGWLVVAILTTTLAETKIISLIRWCQLNRLNLLWWFVALFQLPFTLAFLACFSCLVHWSIFCILHLGPEFEGCLHLQTPPPLAGEKKEREKTAAIISSCLGRCQVEPVPPESPLQESSFGQSGGWQQEELVLVSKVNQQ